MGIPRNPSAPKHELFSTFLQKLKFDVFGAQEINLHFPRLPASEQWKRRFLSWPGFTFAATNTHSSSRSKTLFGGTATFLSPHATAQMDSYGEDPRGLGRWTWVLINGRHGLRTRIITAYRPTTDHSNSAGTVYSQQELVLQAQGITSNPREAFLEDLAHQIRGWMEAGDQIVIGMDANDFTRSGRMEAWRTSLSLIHVHSQAFPNKAEVPTCNKSTHSTHAIDAIWTTADIAPVACGMTGFGEFDFGRTDHRLLWLDNFACPTVFTMNSKSRALSLPHNILPV